MRPILLAVIVALLCACSREEPKPPNVPPEIATLAGDALHAASQIKVSGNIEAVLREHPLAPRYVDAMRKHFEMMRMLHGVGLQSNLRYPRYALQVRHDQFCQDDATANLVVTTMVRYDYEHIPPVEGAPPYTAGEEEHVFRFERRGGVWMMAHHHEISLAEMHQEELVTRLRNPCGV